MLQKLEVSADRQLWVSRSRLIKAVALGRNAAFSISVYSVKGCNRLEKEKHHAWDGSTGGEGGGGGGCTHQSFKVGGSAPRFKPLSFYIPVLIERYPFRIPSIENCTPFIYLRSNLY